jgi:MFS family permease
VQHWTAVLLAIYGAALVVVSPIAGWAADHMGARRMPLLVSLLVLLAASMMLCFGRSVNVFIVGRLLLGISGAVVWSVEMALVVDSVLKAEVGQCLGHVFMSISMACLVAPLVGVVVYAAAGYYAVFYISFGLIAVNILLRVALIEKKDTRKWISKDEMDQPLLQIEVISTIAVGNNVNSPIRTSAIGLLQHLQLLYLPSELDIDEQIQQVTLYFYCMQY